MEAGDRGRQDRQNLNPTLAFISESSGRVVFTYSIVFAEFKLSISDER
jgi:hypothetical protein